MKSVRGHGRRYRQARLLTQPPVVLSLRPMNTEDVIKRATIHLMNLQGHVFDVLNVGQPVSAAAAVNLAKVVSKLSPLVGNLIEFNTTEILNRQPEFHPFGRWVRQDPDF